MADLQVFLAGGINEQTLQPLIRPVGDRVGKGGPAQTVGAPDPGQPYAITMEFYENQHGQGVSGGLIRNDDTLVHSFRVVVAFSDPNGALLNDTWGTTPDVPPGVTVRWQATLPSGLPNTSVVCEITEIELVT